jgi:nucleoside triphosphate diphosphatase
VESTQENAGSGSSSPGASLDRALGLVEFLRAHCPWDAAQTPSTLLRHLVEETYEVVDAVVREDDAALRDELGDLLLNLAFQLVLGEERGGLDREAVVRQLEEKMRRRHPHLFGLGEAEEWESIKARERAERGAARGASGANPGLLDELPSLDPLARAHRMQEIVARVGFDWPDPYGAWEKVREEVEEARAELDAGDADALEAELGDLLFSVINLARRAGIYAPAALARTNAKFIRRFQQLESLAGERGADLRDMDLEAMDRLWDEVKRRERDLPEPDRGGG